MKKLQPVITLFIILILPLVIYFFLKGWTHRVKPINTYGPRIANPDGSPDSVYKSVGDFAFVSQTGDTITRDSVFDVIWVASVFSKDCKRGCARVVPSLKQVYDYPFENYFGDYPQVKFLTFTKDPENDSVKALLETAEEYGVNNHKWYFLTGNKKDLDSFFVKELLLPTVTSDSAEGNGLGDRIFRLMDQQGRFRGYPYDVTDQVDVDSLIDHIKLLKREYKQNQEDKKG